MAQPPTHRSTTPVCSTHAPRERCCAASLQVFSDEFQAGGRSLGARAGDPRWTAVDLWYSPTSDEEVYKEDAVTTRGEADGAGVRPAAQSSRAG